jgi:hypothetical protein
MILVERRVRLAANLFPSISSIKKRLSSLGKSVWNFDETMESRDQFAEVGMRTCQRGQIDREGFGVSAVSANVYGNFRVKGQRLRINRQVGCTRSTLISALINCPTMTNGLWWAFPIGTMSKCARSMRWKFKGWIRKRQMENWPSENNETGNEGKRSIVISANNFEKKQRFN